VTVAAICGAVAMVVLFILGANPYVAVASGWMVALMVAFIASRD